jgi:hypothetical protein
MFTQDALPPRRPGEYILVDENDERAYGIDGLLRPGFKVRVPLVTLDAARLPFAAAPQTIRTGLVGEHALRNFFHVDGSPRRRKVQMRDPQGRESGSFEEEDARISDGLRAAASPHRPGFRTADVSRATVDTGQSLKDAAYSEMCDFVSRQWRGEPEHQQTADAQRTADPPPPAGVSPSDWARHLTMVEDARAWMPKDVDTSKIGAQAPHILPLGAVPKHIGTVKAGDRCTVDGADGVFVDGGDGNLYCKVRPMPTTRIDVTPPRFMDAATAQKIRDAAWLESVERVSNAWRT